MKTQHFILTSSATTFYTCTWFHIALSEPLVIARRPVGVVSWLIDKGFNLTKSSAAAANGAETRKLEYPSPRNRRGKQSRLSANVKMPRNLKGRALQQVLDTERH